MREKMNKLYFKDITGEKLNRYFNAKATMWDHE